MCSYFFRGSRTFRGLALLLDLRIAMDGRTDGRMYEGGTVDDDGWMDG